MSLPQDAVVRLEAFLELLQRFAGFEIQADVRQGTSVPISEFPSVEILVEFSGRDEALLLANQGELLTAMESLAADFLELDGAARQTVRFDSGQLRADRERALTEIARPAEDDVPTSHMLNVFAPMSGSDRPCPT